MWPVTVLSAVVSLLILNSYKYLPGVYTLRFFKIVLKYYYFQKLEKNDSPFVLNQRSSRCSLFECDVFGFHKSNSTYFTELDLCRTECFMNTFHKYFKLNKYDHAFIPLASINNFFLKEIKPFQKFDVVSKIVGWDSKWIFIVSMFLIDDGKGFKELPELKENCPLYAKSSSGGIKRVSCISTGKLIFKHGRVTAKPFDIIGQTLDLDNPTKLNKIHDIATANANSITRTVLTPMELITMFNSV